MSANIEELVRKHSRAFSGDVRGLRNALTEQAEAFKGELQAYDGMVRELTKTVEDMRAAQPVPVVGEPVAWVRKDKLQHVNTFGPALCHVYATEQPGTVALIIQPSNSITSAELATLREKAAEADELQKRAERMQKALSDIAEWTDRYTTPGHPVSTIASAAIAQGKGE